MTGEGAQSGVAAQQLVPRYRKVFVMAPANTVTGGPEALHQLVDAIRALGGEAFVSYYPHGTAADTPQDYRRYNVVQAAPEDEPGNLMVLPETQPLMAREFARAKVGIWWLSIDNFLYLKERPGWDELGRHVNFAQSRYAADFLARQGVESVFLTDYLNNDFLTPPRRTRRRNAIAYNVKSAEEIERLKQSLPELARLTWIELSDMPREKIRTLLSEVKIFIDFGHHPGRDRMPREAALSGACVLTNRRGSADFDEDVPLPARYKLDQRDPAYARNVARTIRSIFALRPLHAWRLKAYRHFAASGREGFMREVRDAFFEPAAHAS